MPDHDDKRGVTEFAKEHPDTKQILVSRDRVSRRSGDVDLYGPPVPGLLRLVLPASPWFGSRRHFGKSLPHHHHALADAEACAAIALKLL